MQNDNYLLWLGRETATTWWHDSGDPQELDAAIANGAVGVTTNPVLSSRAINGRPEYWRPLVGSLAAGLSAGEQAEQLMRAVVVDASRKMVAQHSASGGADGYVCAQVNPARAHDRETMLDMARRFNTWGPNIAVKLPVTAAGLDVLEECVAEGITITATVSFTVPQVVAIAERHRKGVERARKAGVNPGHCFAVIMIGRLDDYLTAVAVDNQAGISEDDFKQAGLAVTKRAYDIYEREGYEAVLLVAALRGTYHMTELAGAKLIMSIHPRYQTMLLVPDVAKEERIAVPVDPKVVARLQKLPEFVRSYEPDGMTPNDFIQFGATQRTLTQFSEVGWGLLESFKGF